MLETRFAPESLPSASLRSPDGRSITSVGAAGFDGLVKAYCVSDVCRLMSMKGIRDDILGVIVHTLHRNSGLEKRYS